MSGAVDFDEALRRWLDGAPGPTLETLDLRATAGRVLAETVRAKDALPPFDNAAMDGYALRLQGDGLPAGTRCALSGAQFAGDGRIDHLAEAVEITTGALLPAGYDAVVPVERTVLDGDALTLAQDVRRGQHIRRLGQDVEAGVEVMRAGRWIDAEVLTMLASLGLGQIQVARRPRIAVIATGRELVDDPGVPLAPGQIRNGNRPGLVARIHAAGGECVYDTTIGDDGGALLAAISAAEAAGAEVILSSGAVSMGRHDFVPATLERLGVRCLFHKLKMRPGKPLLAARLPSGAWYAGLPGNPVSAAVGFRFFVEPLMRRLLGLPDEQPAALPLAHPLADRGGFRFHLKARLVLREGRVAVELLHGQESFRIAPLLAATCWAVQPADSGPLDLGAPIATYPLCHAQALPFFLASAN